jgi:hypothetical protein
VLGGSAADAGDRRRLVGVLVRVDWGWRVRELQLMLLVVWLLLLVVCLLLVVVAMRFGCCRVSISVRGLNSSPRLRRRLRDLLGDGGMKPLVRRGRRVI